MPPHLSYPNWNERKDPLYQILLKTRNEASGIVPISTGAEHHDVNRDVAHLSPEEQRVLKRKFRKAWRRAAKKELQQAGNSPKARAVVARRASQEYGLKTGQPPNRKQKRNRKAAVNGMFQKEAWAARKALMKP